MAGDIGSSNKRVLIGRVVSNKMEKTVVVEVDRRVLHPRYRKYISRRQRYVAHDEENLCQVDEVVTIRESRPLSRTKRWVVIGRGDSAGATKAD